MNHNKTQYLNCIVDSMYHFLIEWNQISTPCALPYLQGTTHHNSVCWIGRVGNNICAKLVTIKFCHKNYIERTLLTCLSTHEEATNEERRRSAPAKLEEEHHCSTPAGVGGTPLLSTRQSWRRKLGVRVYRFGLSWGQQMNGIHWA